MDIILSKNEQMEKLEKRLRLLEHKMDRNFSRTNESFETFRKVIIELQKENVELKRDRDFLLDKYKDVIRKLELPVGVHPIKEAINENLNLIREVALEGFGVEKNRKNIDDLFELVINNNKISLKSAAKRLGVTEKKSLFWALTLQKKGLIGINNKFGKTELRKTS